MSNRRKISIAFLLIGTFVLAGAALFFANQTANDQSATDSRACGPSACPNIVCNGVTQNGTDDPNYNTCDTGKSCADRANDFCSGLDRGTFDGVQDGNGGVTQAPTQNTGNGESTSGGSQTPTTPNTSTGSAGGSCTPGAANNCPSGYACTVVSPSDTRTVCNLIPEPEPNSGLNAAGCPGTETCDRIITFQCDSLSDFDSNGGSCFEGKGSASSFSTGLSNINGCGQVDTVCSGSDTLCGDFQIVKSSCGGTTTSNPPTTPTTPTTPSTTTYNCNPDNNYSCSAVTGSGGTYSSAGSCDTACNPPVGQCVSLTPVGPSELRIGEGNSVEYIFVYESDSATAPLSQEGTFLTVEGSRGRALSDPTSTQVPTSAVVRNAAAGTWTYRFVWEAADTTGTVVTALTDGTFDVSIQTNGEAVNTAGCTSDVTVSTTAQAEPNFQILKSAVESCGADNDSVVTYTIEVTNIGSVEGVIDSVTDTFDQTFVELGLEPTGISPDYGTYSDNPIAAVTWSGTEQDRTFESGESKSYSFTVTIDAADKVNVNSLENTASVVFDTVSETDNVNSFTYEEILDCLTVIPNTAFGDDSRFIYLLISMALVLSGFAVYWFRFGENEVKLFGKRIFFTLDKKAGYEKELLDK